MKILHIAWRLLRYRVAVMLTLFMLVAAALHGGLHGAHFFRLLVACLALAASYISATSVNDLADYNIDAINHAQSPGRPLISGGAARRDVWIIFALSSAISILCAVSIGTEAALIMMVAVVINVLYSLPPARISYRTFLAPLFLGLGYVCVPYALGAVAASDTLRHYDIAWMAGLYLLFVGRILLKDFRDRKGDAKYGKPTFLLRFGKGATCTASALLISAGGAVLAWQTHRLIWLTLLVLLFVATILSMLWRLYRSAPGTGEQISIGVGAKMGNGLLVTLLSAFALADGTDQQAAAVAACLVANFFFLSFVNFWRDPSRAVLGYRG